MTRSVRTSLTGLAPLAFIVSAMLTAQALGQMAAPGEPVLVGSYGWEDGVGTILHSTGNLADPTNVAAEAGVMPNSGKRMLRVTEAPHAGTPQAHIAYITGLTDGDIVRAGVHVFDDTPAGSPSMRIWAHYAHSSNLTQPVTPAFPTSQQNEDFSSGIGWEELSNEWTFNSNNGARDSLVIEVRLFSTPATCAECSTDFYIDDTSIEVFCAANPDLTIIFPDGTTVVDPLLPHEQCAPILEPFECETDLILADYDWEDGFGTLLGANTSASNYTADNNSTLPHTGKQGLHVTTHTSGDDPGNHHMYLAHIRNLQPGDRVVAGFWTYDDTPGAGPAGYPSVRIFGHYTNGDNINPTNQAGGNEDWPLGIGWEELTHEWVFEAPTGSQGPRDGLVIQARLYFPPCPEGCDNDYFIDDLWIDVCAADPEAVEIILPDSADPPLVCKNPAITGTYGWEDGAGTVVGNTNPTIITTANVTDFVNTGSHALRVTESPHHNSANPQIWLAHVRNLSDGDIVSASFWTYDDTPGQGPSGYPSVRMWSHYTSGSTPTSSGPIAQNLQNQVFSSGTGWEEMSHAWVFDSNGGEHSGMVIRAIIYSPACPEGEVCSTDFHFDDLTVNVCTPNAKNVLISFPDAFVVEPDPPIEMCEEPMSGLYGWEDGKSTIIGADSSAIEADNVDDFVFSGDNALKVTETGHTGGAREVYFALVENLQPGDTVRAGFMAYDDTPGVNPRVRIWGRYAVTGDPFLKTSADGNDDFTTGIGWEPLEHTWLFNPPAHEVPRNAMMIMARVYSANCPEEEQPCVAEYFFDDMFVEACGDHPNLTITFADGDVIGEPGDPQDCVADVDGSGDIDIFDVFALLGAWGTADSSADVNGDGTVDGADLGITLASFGPCAEFLFPMRGSAQLILEDLPAGSERQYDLYVQLDADETLANIYDGNVSSSLGFGGGSFITIGDSEPNFDIAEDPNFDFSAFSGGTHLGTNAGWYNFNPTNNLGLAGLYPDNRVLIARLFVDEATEFDATLSVTYRDGAGRARQAHLNLDPAKTPCPADVTDDGNVNIFDLLFILSNWGPCADPNDCPADVTDDGNVNIFDLLFILSNWGPCP